MAKQAQGPVTVQTGQADVDPQKVEGITEPTAPPTQEPSQKAPDVIEGQTQPDEPTSPPESEPGKSVPAEESFFDPKELDEKLVPAYKQLHAAWTKKMMALGKDKEKVEAYDAFFTDPVTSLKQAAGQYGMKMEPIRGTPAPGTPGEASTPGSFDANWQPQTWEEVFQAFAPKIVNQIQSTLQTTFAPVFDNLKTLTTSNVERQLGEIDGNWKVYEDEMTESLKAHPTLAKDVAKLYRVSVPENVLTARATQEALKKFETKAASAKIQGKSSVQSSVSPTNQKVSFDQAVINAKKELGM